MPTSRPKLKVIVTRRLPEPVETRMSELFDVELNATDTPMTIEQLADAAQRCDVLVPTVTDRIDGRTLARAGDRLRLIAQFGVGVDNIDVQACVSRGVTVTNTPGVLTEDTADMTMGADPRRAAPHRRRRRRHAVGTVRRLVADLDVGPPHLMASASALSAWVASARPSPAGRKRLACRSTTTTASRSVPPSPKSLRRLTRKASTRCWRGWTSSR